jgi:predicted ATP-dependent endonuclease of OLD family
MKLIKARVQNYRSIIDSGLFEIEKLKTILVGPNEAGKTVLLRALQQLNKPEDVEGFKAIRDYPRSLYNDITTNQIKPEDVEVVRGYFKLDEEDKSLVDSEFKNCTYVLYRKLDNKGYHHLEDVPNKITIGAIKKDLLRIVAHIDKQFEAGETETTPDKEKPSVKIKSITPYFRKQFSIKTFEAA